MCDRAGLIADAAAFGVDLIGSDLDEVHIGDDELRTFVEWVRRNPAHLVCDVVIARRVLNAYAGSTDE